jgi:hypothetical protein
MILEGSDIMRITTTTAATLTVFAAFTDIGPTRTARGRQTTAISSATTTTILSGPGGVTDREVSTLAVANTHASLSDTVTLEHYNGTTAAELWKGTLGPGERLAIVGGVPTVFNSSGVPKAAPIAGANQSAVLASPLFATANLTSVRSITSTNTYAVYIGRAPRALTSVGLRYRVTTGAATITWAELAIAKGAVNVGGGPTLTVVGYADVSGTVTGTGQFTTAVNVSPGQSINEGDDLWALYGNNASTVTVLRAQSIADDLQSGVFAYLSTRPSTNVGNAQAYTIDGATALAPWIVGVV